MAKETTTLTTAGGAPVPDNQNSITAGARGPVLLQDWQLIEKLAHQNRERIPERVVHAKGWGAHGTLTVTNDITRYTRAKLFSAVGKTDPADRPVLHGRGRGGCRRRRAGRARVRGEILHRGRQLGPGGEQHAGILRARPAEVPGLHPHPEAPSEDQSAVTDRDVGFLVAQPGKPASGHHSDVRPRLADQPAFHERLRQPHVQLLE